MPSPAPPAGRRIVVATDYDRTFTRPDLALSTKAVAAARRLRDSGVGVLLVTGRREDALPMERLGGCFDGYVLEGGAIWGRPGQWHFRTPRPALGLARQALEQAGYDVEPGRASLSAPAEAEAALAPWAAELSIHRNADRLDVTSIGVHKGYGLAKALAWLGWTQPHVVAVGDSPNDIPLFEAASESMAVANAVPELAAVADVRLSAAADAGFVEAAGLVLSRAPLERAP